MTLCVFSSKQLYIFLALLCKLRSLAFPGTPDQTFGTSSSLSTQEDKEILPMAVPPATRYLPANLQQRHRPVKVAKSKQIKGRETRTENKG